jgi:hypothetical protein
MHDALLLGLDEIAAELETTHTLDDVLEIVKEWQAQLAQQFLNNGELETAERTLAVVENREPMN